jgi:hypothetical protein
MPTAVVKSVDYVTTKGGRDAWQVITDYDHRDADGLNRCAFYLPHAGPAPAVGASVTWGDAFLRGGWADWGAGKVRRLEFMFDPGDLRLYAG